MYTYMYIYIYIYRNMYIYIYIYICDSSTTCQVYAIPSPPPPWEVGGTRLETSSRFVGSKKNVSRASIHWCIWNTEGCGFIEFEMSSNTISTVFCQHLTLATLANRFSTPALYRCNGSCESTLTLPTLLPLRAPWFTLRFPISLVQALLDTVHTLNCPISHTVLAANTCGEVSFRLVYIASTSNWCNVRQNLSQNLWGITIATISRAPSSHRPQATAGTHRASASPIAANAWQLQDGVRTNGVITEVPQFPILKLCGEMWHNMFMWQHMITCGKIWQHVCAYSKACPSVVDLWLFCGKPRLSRPCLEAGVNCKGN